MLAESIYRLPAALSIFRLRFLAAGKAMLHFARDIHCPGRYARE